MAISTSPQKITTFLMFEGRAEEAMRWYTSLFPDAEVLSVSHYGPGEDGPEGTVRHALFSLAGQPFMCIDSPAKHGFGFTPSMSLYVQCDSEEEIDRLYAALADGGQALMPLGSYGFSARFGWVNDRFGVSWQLTLPGGGD
ncbi:VOC family protein [Streptacidiphilus pinicola]|uniref:VOC family protein n=1 Tax=Streptacidiphilus pinicola TaxID=2219663 RepID=A0A2X0IQQ5_9ACTN|nr:VOC family protein [Streptacidiphilus pinicola]RAG87544.1 VOC family protein [Streptacidiphilus pinicola]